MRLHWLNKENSHPLLLSFKRSKLVHTDDRWQFAALLWWHWEKHLVPRCFCECGHKMDILTFFSCAGPVILIYATGSSNYQVVVTYILTVDQNVGAWYDLYDLSSSCVFHKGGAPTHLTNHRIRMFRRTSQIPVTIRHKKPAKQSKQEGSKPQQQCKHNKRILRDMYSITKRKIKILYLCYVPSAITLPQSHQLWYFHFWSKCYLYSDTKIMTIDFVIEDI